MKDFITQDEIPKRREQLVEEAEVLLARNGEELTEADSARWTEVEAELTELAEREQRYKTLRELADKPGHTEAGAAFGTPQLMRRSDPYEARSNETPEQVRSRSLSAIETWDGSDESKEGATDALNRAAFAGKENVEGVARHMLDASHPAYVSAFRKYASNPHWFMGELSREEAHAWQVMNRAVLATAGAVLPSPLDPAIVLTNASVEDPMRSVARVVPTTAKEHRFITSAGSTFSFDAEAAEVSDDTPTLAEVTITNHKAQGFIQATIEAWGDQPNSDQEIAKIIADGKANLEGAKFITGSGTNEPWGVETRMTGAAGEKTAAGEAIVGQDVYNVAEALAPPHRPQAQ